MKYYFNYLKGQMIGRIIFHLIYITAMAGIPYVIKSMIDSSFEYGFKSVIYWSLAFILCILSAMIGQYLSQLFAWKVTKKYFAKIRADLFNSIILQSPNEFSIKDSGEYSSEMINDVSTSEEYIEYFLSVIESFISLVVYATFLWMLNYKLALVIYFTTCLTIFLPKLTGGILSKKQNALLKHTAIYTSKVIDLFKGYDLVNSKSYSNISNAHIIELTELEEKRYDLGKFKTFTNVFNALVMYIIHIGAFFTLAYLLFKKNITVGVATATFAYITDFSFPLRTIIDSLSYMKGVSGVTRQLMTKGQGYETPLPHNIPFNSIIELNNVTFQKQDFILGPLNIKFKKGMKYLIVGESGKGKSTLLNILFGNLQPLDGKILIDNKELSYRKLREIIFYNSQFSNVFSDNYANNVTLFDTFTIQEAIILPEKHKNKILKSDNCSQLSGGQKQMIKLQRALLSQMPILLMDEPFSAMNSELEIDLTKKLVQLDKTIILVSHNTNPDYLNLFDEVIYL